MPVTIADGSVKAYYHMANTTDEVGSFALTQTNGNFLPTGGKLGTGAWDSLSTDGSTNHLTAAAGSQDLAGDFSCGFWFKVNTTIGGGGGYFFVAGTGGSTGVDFAYQRLCTVGNFESKVSTTCSDGPWTQDTGVWHWGLVTRTGSTITLYLDNSSISSDSGSGTASPNGSVWFNGAVDDTTGIDFEICEYFFMNRILTSTERNALWNSGSGDSISLVSTSVDINLSDSVSVAEAVTMMIDENISVNDAVTTTDVPTVQNLTLGPVSVSDTVTVTESISLVYALDVSVNEAVTITESITINNTNLGGISVNDTATITEAVIMGGVDLGDISVIDTINVTEFVNLDFTLDVSVSDAVLISEGLAFDIELNLSTFEAVTVSETVLFRIVAARRGLVYMRSQQQKYPVPMDQGAGITKMRSQQQGRPKTMDDNRTL